MEIVGKLIALLPEETGEGKNGMWKKRQFVIETQENYPKKVCFVAWGDKVDLNSFRQEEQIRVFFDPESREWNGRWFTDLKAWRVDKNQGGGAQDQSPSYSQDTAAQVFTSEPPAFEDDLPF